MSELYKLPAGWEWKKLGDFVSIKGGKRLPKGEKLRETKTDYPYIRVADFNNFNSIDINSVQYISKEVFDKIKNYTISKDDIYISIAGTIGKTGVIPVSLDGANLTENAAKIVFDISEYNQSFLVYFTTTFTFLDQIGLATKTVAMPKLALTRLKNVQIPLPPLAEQKLIVAKLDSLFGKIDKAIELHQQNITNANTLMASTLYKTFKKLEGEYSKQKIESFSKVGTGVTPLKSRKDYYNGSINWITSKATGYDFVTEAEMFITDFAIKECRLKVYPKGTLVVALYGQGKTRGQVTELLIESATNQAVATIVVDKNQNNKYLKFFLKKSYLDLREKASGGTQANLNLTIIKNIEVPLPPLQTQQQTVEYLDSIATKVDKIKQLNEQKLENLKALKASILDKAFRGEL
ncbi:hypothetical protein LO80_09625 [Candidatus Francisella endociliophora]|uniref:Type I restriction modification DNA specificity domain-containing protein n=1 Tax=Candidatus Francisella endociliophora TaxID=653937 RepID=A0A097ERK4_9GAMM|nr:restriction endonuclease subunit S [Francisella sp. FSC1006]AIT10203.1 hypothetical protein LO80_09625 [Francisella sp. FSC1006]